MKHYEDYVNAYESTHSMENRRDRALWIITSFLIDNGIANEYKNDEDTLFEMYRALRKYPEAEQEMFAIESIICKSPIGIFFEKGKVDLNEIAEWYGISL